MHIHSSSTRRSILFEEDWKKVWTSLHKIWAENLISGEWDPSIKVEWSTWYKNRGLIACKNETTVNFIRNLISEVQFDGKSFRAWKRGEFGFPSLVTLFLPEGTQGYIFA